MSGFGLWFRLCPSQMSRRLAQTLREHQRNRFMKARCQMRVLAEHFFDVVKLNYVHLALNLRDHRRAGYVAFHEGHFTEDVAGRESRNRRAALNFDGDAATYQDKQGSRPRIHGNNQLLGSICRPAYLGTQQGPVVLGQNVQLNGPSRPVTPMGSDAAYVTFPSRAS